MIRLHIFGEGHSEKSFVNQLLVEHLSKSDVFATVSAFMTSFDRRSGRKHTGGINDYKKIKKEIMKKLSEDKDPSFRVSTMIDLYALPSNFPRYEEAKEVQNIYKKVEFLESALFDDINDSRFIPYIQVHEFEALIFADPSKLEIDYLGHEEGIKDLVALSKRHKPEEINDNPETAPSKRIKQAVPTYDKCFSAASTTKEIGLDVMRSKCKHFDEWLTKLESLRQLSTAESIEKA